MNATQHLESPPTVSEEENVASSDQGFEFPEPPEGLFRVQDQLAAGGLVLSVPADDSQKATAASILGGHGGHGMAHFGRDHWEPLGA